jgi:hypothetical protein
MATKVEEVNQSSYKPTDAEEKILENVYTRYSAMKNNTARTDAEADWDEADKQYKAEVTALDSDDYRTNLNKPIVFATIETELQETIERNSRPRTRPREYTDFARASFANDVLDYSFDIGKFDYQYYLAKKEAHSRGTGFIFDYYRVDKRKVKRINLEKNGEEQEFERVDFDDCYAEWIPCEMIYVDPAANHIDKAIDAIIREILNIDAFKQKYGSRHGFYNIDLVVPGGDTNTSTYYEPPKDLDKGKEVEILHYYNRNTDNYDVVVNNVVVRTGGIPYNHKEIPLVVVYNYKPVNQFYGMGTAKIIQSLVEERNTNANLRLDTQKMSIGKMFFFDDMIELDDIDLTPRPHGGIPINTNGKSIDQVIKWIEYSDVKPSTFKEEEVLVEDIHRTTGIDDRLQGVNQAGSATEAAILKESSMKRINAKMKLMEMDAMNRLGRLRLSNIKQFYSIKKMESIVSKNGESIKKTWRTISLQGKKYTIDGDGNLKLDSGGDTYNFEINKDSIKFLDGQFDIVCDPSFFTPVSKPLQQAKITEMWDRLTKDPLIMKELDVRMAMKRYLEINDEKADAWMKKVENDGVDMILLANMENDYMAAGQPLPPTPGATPEHTQIHLNKAQSAEYQSYPEVVQLGMEAHIKGEGEAMGALSAGGADMSSQLPPPGVNMGDVAPGLNTGASGAPAA